MNQYLDVLMADDRRGFVLDKNLAVNAFMETPFGLPSTAGRTNEQLFRTPGCCVKSKAPVLKAINALTTERAFGKLSIFDERKNRVVVLGFKRHGEEFPFVWIGTLVEYEIVWEGD